MVGVVVIFGCDRFSKPIQWLERWLCSNAIALTGSFHGKNSYVP